MSDSISQLFGSKSSAKLRNNVIVGAISEDVFQHSGMK